MHKTCPKNILKTDVLSIYNTHTVITSEIFKKELYVIGFIGL